MRLEINRHPAAMERGAFAGMVSAKAGQGLAELMQYVGIASISLAERRSFLGSGMSVESVEPFEGVPQDLMYYMASMADGMAKCMEAFGIVKLSLQPEDGDLDSLAAVWKDVVAARPAPQSESVNTPKAEQPQEEKPNEPEEPEDKHECCGGSGGSGCCKGKGGCRNGKKPEKPEKVVIPKLFTP